MSTTNTEGMAAANTSRLTISFKCLTSRTSAIEIPIFAPKTRHHQHSDALQKDQADEADEDQPEYSPAGPLRETDAAGEAVERTKLLKVQTGMVTNSIVMMTKPGTISTMKPSCVIICQ